MSFEDELRTLLHERVAAPPDNPRRTAEVRRRITTTKRRRVAGGALALVLVALAGLAVLRLPGTNESLPPAVPAPPFFTDGPLPTAPGWQYAAGSQGRDGFVFFVAAGQHVRYALVAVCPAPGEVTVRNAERGEPVSVPCRTKEGDRWVGVTAVSPERAETLFALVPDPLNVRVDAPPGAEVHLLNARAPDRLPDDDGGETSVVDGRRTRDGATVEVTVPPLQQGAPEGYGFAITVECVAGVEVGFRVPDGELATADCDPLSDRPEEQRLRGGRVTVVVSAADMTRLGLAHGQRTRLTVTRGGTDTDQWRVLPLG